MMNIRKRDVFLHLITILLPQVGQVNVSQRIECWIKHDGEKFLLKSRVVQVRLVAFIMPVTTLYVMVVRSSGSIWLDK